MSLSRSGKRILLYFAAAFLGSGFLHIFLDYNMEFFNVFWVNHFTQTLMCIFAMFWGISIYKRITDRRQKTLLLWITFFLLLLFSLQVSKYRLFSGMIAERRYLWYGYYIPMIAIPALLFCVALLVQKPPKEPLPMTGKIVAGIGAALSALFLSNDLHQLAFRFTGPVWDDDNSVHMPVFYVYCAYYVIVLALSFFVLIKKARRIQKGITAFYPILPVLVYIFLSALDILGATPRIDGLRIWNVGEEYAFAITGFIEICIQIGLIPSNSDYKSLFRILPLGAGIEDEKRQVVYTSGELQKNGDEERYIKEYRHDISGGAVQWEADISGLVKREQELAEMNEQLLSRQQYLKQQNEVLKEQARLKAQNELYDRIFAAVRPQLSGIETMLGEDENTAGPVPPKVAVLAAFVKRRSNMELSAEDGLLSSDELSMALFESVENLKLCGISAVSSGVGSGRYPAELIILLYEAFERVTEEGLEGLEGLMVSLRSEKESLSLRMLLRGAGLTAQEVLDAAGDAKALQGVELSAEEEEGEISLSMICRNILKKEGEDDPV